MRTDVTNLLSNRQDVNNIHNKVMDILSDIVDKEGVDTKNILVNIMYTDYILSFEIMDDISILYVGIITVDKDKAYVEYGEWKNTIHYDKSPFSDGVI